MTEIVNKFLLEGDNCMPGMDLRQPRFAYSTCRPFTKIRERIQKFKETWDSRYIYQNELGEACFQHDTAYGDFKDLTKRTASDKILCDKGFNIAKNLKYDKYQRGFASIVCKMFNKKSSGSGIKNENLSDQQLEEELHKPIIRTFEKKSYTQLL